LEQNRSKLEHLFDAHWGAVYRECARILGHPAMAEEAAGETFMRAWRAMDNFDDRNPLGWLLKIARNVCINILRKPAAGRELTWEHLPEPRQGSEPSMDVVLLLTVLPRMIASLDPHRRAVLKLYLHGYSYAETAGLMGCTVGDVKTHLQTAFRQLHKLWVSGKMAEGDSA
jgi:RNA polymerase sigma-70 factor, ECF subfamily